MMWLLILVKIPLARAGNEYGLASTAKSEKKVASTHKYGKYALIPS